MDQKSAIIIGGGPAGLTAAFELLEHTTIHPIVVEYEPVLGGLARTEKVEGNRIDIGGHRFFSKSDVVMRWWLEMLPIQRGFEDSFKITYRGQQRRVNGRAVGPDPEEADEVMLVRPRSSRIFWRNRLLDYPLRLSPDTIRKIGFATLTAGALSYAKAKAFPVRKEESLEDFLINRFGRKLYALFFQSYTEKVWGVPCREISAEWGAQRIKGLDIGKVIQHALNRTKNGNDVGQKSTETSLIERFLYPKYGPGQMWETVGRRVRARGGQILLEHEATGLRTDGARITHVEVRDRRSGAARLIPADYVLSSMPIRELVAALRSEVPGDVREVADGLVYRDFFTVGLLVDRLELGGNDGRLLEDNWCYIQEPAVSIGRVQIFNNWSPYLVEDPNKVWLGLEYFCFEEDELWSRSDDELIELGTRELGKIGMIDPARVRLGKVIRVKKTYPAYFGSYARFGRLREYLDTFSNLYCLGRNGQHRYNNQDHSMLTAMRAVEAISKKQPDKSPVWSVNVEQEYHEER